MDIWRIVTDFATVSCLLLVCKLIRTRWVLAQKLLMPVAMIAGLLGLVLGPYGTGLLSFSPNFHQYGSFLITIVFAAVGLATRFPSMRLVLTRVGSLWTFNQTIVITQWIVGIVVGGFLFPMIWPNISIAMGLIIPAGFMGGHGTAVAMGNTFASLGWSDAMTLMLASATCGVFFAIIFGLAIIRYGVRKGWVAKMPSFASMPDHERRGLIQRVDQASIGRETVSASSLDVLSMHAALVLVVSGAAYAVSHSLSALSPYASVPVFACGFVLGSFVRMLLHRLRLWEYFDNKIFSHAANLSTDYLIVFGIISIQISVLMEYFIPFFILMLAGLISCLMMLFFVAPKLLDNNWFEKGVFSWGWMTGTVAMGMLLLRIVDPLGKTSILDDYAIAYVPGAVVDIVLISLLPAVIMSGYLLEALLALIAYLSIVYILHWVMQKRTGL